MQTRQRAMANFHQENISGKLFLNGQLFSGNDRPLKFYLDGYNPYEFHAISKIIEAYGGKLTLPDKETIIFSEPDRDVQNYYYRYDIKYVYNCLVANKMLNIQKYLLPRPMTADILIAELPLSSSTIKEDADALNLEKNDALHKSPKILFPTIPSPIKEEPEGEITLNSNEKFHESRQLKMNNPRLFPKKSINAETSDLMPVAPTTSQRKKLSLTSDPGFPKEPELICVSDDSDSQLGNLPDSTKTVNNAHFKSSITEQNAKSENRCKRMKIASSSTPRSSDTLVNSNLPSTSNGVVGHNRIFNRSQRTYTVSSDSEGEFEDAKRKNGLMKRTVARKSTTKNGGAVINHVNGKAITKERKKVPYSDNENRKMIQFLIEKNAISRADKIGIWKELVKAKILQNPVRLAYNLQTYFRRKLLNKAHFFTDDPRAVKEFRRLLHKKELNDNNEGRELNDD